jgi:hypothetical protein
MQTGIRQLLGTLLLVAVFAGAYYAVSNVDFFSSARLTREQVDQQTQQIEGEIIAQLAALEQITLDGKVFETKEFQSLIDMTVVLERPAINRPDPFAAY